MEKLCAATIYTDHVLDGLAKIEENSIDCCVTSPPYWGLRDYGFEGQIGLEPTPEAYVEKMVEVFEQVRRVLKPSGTCWLNIGDTYNNSDKWGGGGANTGKHVRESSGDVPSWKAVRRKWSKIDGLKPKDLCLIPFRLALALQAAGWYVRSDIIWAKPNPMPESVTDRPTTAHEHIFLLTKSAKYFYDADAVREPAAYLQPNSPESIKSPHGQGFTRRASVNNKTFRGGGAYTSGKAFHNGSDVPRASHGNEPNESLTRNLRSVWTIATRPYPEAHFATFPEELPRRCIKAGCPEAVCSECGAPYEREKSIKYENPGNRSTNGPRSEERKHQKYGTAGFKKRLEKRVTVGNLTGRCECDAARRPPVVLDPFAGSGTTLQAALELDRNAIGIELSPEYVALIEKRLGRGVQRELSL